MVHRADQGLQEFAVVSCKQEALFSLICRLHMVQVYGVVGNPVAHSRSPALHNAALEHADIDAVYIPYLVDDMQKFLDSFADSDFRGFSVTIPHKVEPLT